MDTIIICIAVVIVFAMFSYVSLQYIKKNEGDRKETKAIETLESTVKKIQERMGQLEVGRMR